MSELQRLILTGRPIKDVREDLSLIERYYGDVDYDVVVYGERNGLWAFTKVAEIKEALDGDLHKFLVDKKLISKGKTAKTGGDCEIYIVDDPDMKVSRRMGLRTGTNNMPPKKKKKKGKKTHRK